MQKGVKKFECLHCDLTCRNKSNLKRHIKRRHQEKREEQDDEPGSETSEAVSS